MVNHILTQEAVSEALNQALENGYDFTYEKPTVVAADLTDCHSDFNGDDVLALVPFVVAWQKERRSGKK